MTRGEIHVSVIAQHQDIDNRPPGDVRALLVVSTMRVRGSTFAALPT